MAHTYLKVIATSTKVNRSKESHLHAINVYVSIDQLASFVSSFCAAMGEEGALYNTIDIPTTVTESAVLQYIAPYVETSLAEYSVHQGVGVLLVYGDLNKHAVAN